MEEVGITNFEMTCTHVIGDGQAKSTKTLPGIERNTALEGWSVKVVSKSTRHDSKIVFVAIVGSCGSHPSRRSCTLISTTISSMCT